MARPFAGEIFNCKTCGSDFKRSQSEIKRGRTLYCTQKCSAKAHSGLNNPQYKHGQSSQQSGCYRSWRAMLDRCYVKSSSTYKKYGARGITVCNRWREYANFFADMGERPEGLTLDRIDGSKGYSPENCRWATHLEQVNNQRSNVKVTWEGKEYNLAQLLKKLNLYTKSGVYYSRLKRGWSLEKTLTTPHQRRRPHT